MFNRIGIVGAGAIGAVVGGYLTRAGRDVTLIEQWPAHVEAIRQRGLRLSGPGVDETVKVRALHVHEAQAIAEAFEALFISVKSYDTPRSTTSTATWSSRGVRSACPRPSTRPSSAASTSTGSASRPIAEI